MAINLRTRRSLGNPLVRRVQRHADLATLFRSPQQPYPGFAQSAANLIPGRDLTQAVSSITAPIQAAGSTPRQVPLVSASLIPTSSLPVEAGPAVMQNQAPEVSQPAVARHPETSPEVAAPRPAAPLPEPAVPEEDRPAATPAAPALQRAVEPSRQPAPVQRAQPEPRPGPREEPPPAEPEDRIWNRLQNIFRKHQEKQSQEKQSQEQQTSAEAKPEPEEGSPQAAREAQQSAKIQASREPQQPLPVSETDAQPGRESLQQPEQPGRPEHPGQPQPPAQADVPDQGMPAPASPPQPELSQPSQATGETRLQTPAGKPKPAPPRLDEVAASDHPVGDLPQEPRQSSAQEPLDQLPESSELPQAQADQPGRSPDETLISPPLVVQRRAEPPGTPSADKPALTEPDAEPPQADALSNTQATPTREARLSGTVQTPEPQAAAAPIQPPVPERPSYPADVFAPPEAEEPAEQQAFQPFPLQEAWPVQRMADQPRQAAELQQPAPSSELAHSQEARRVSSLLQEVTPGQPTDSHVEVVTPRRPRPAVPVISSPPEQPDSTVQEKPEDNQSPKPAASPQAALRLPESQRQAPTRQEPSSPIQAAEMPSLVPTEIGALPADLWRLIGAEPPQPGSRPRPPAAPVQRQAAVEPAPVKPSADLEAQTEEQFLSYQAPTFIQRAEATETSETGAGDEAGGEGANLDELSRRVYQEVKRRLATEWERMRRRI